MLWTSCQVNIGFLPHSQLATNSTDTVIVLLTLAKPVHQNLHMSAYTLLNPHCYPFCCYAPRIQAFSSPNPSVPFLQPPGLIPEASQRVFSVTSLWIFCLLLYVLFVDNMHDSSARRIRRSSGDKYLITEASSFMTCNKLAKFFQSRVGRNRGQ